MDLGSIVAHLKLETQQFVNGVRNAVQGVNQIEDSLNNLNQAGSSIDDMGANLNRTFNDIGKGGTKLNRQLQMLAYQLGGEVPESTKQAYTKLYELNNEVRKAERGYGKYSVQAMQARQAVNDWALSLDDTTFKQVYMRSQLGLTDMQLQQQANSIKLNHRMTKLMGDQTQILTQRMQGLQKAGIKPEMLLPASTPGAFRILNETIAQGHSPLNVLSLGFRTLGNNVEGVIKKYSAQKVAVREANGDMVKYGLILRGIQTGLANVTLALPLMGIAAVSAYGKMFSAAIEADAALKGLLDTTKSKLGEAFKPLIEVAGQFLEVILKMVSAIADWVIAFNEAHPAIAKVLAVLGFLLPALTVLMAPLAMGVGLFKGWMLVLNSIWPVISGIVSVMGIASSTALTLLGAIGALAAGFILLWQNSETFRNVCTEVWSTVKSKVSDAITAITGYLNKLKSAFEKGGIKGVLETLKTDITKLVQNIKEKAPEMLDAGFKMIQNFCNAIIQNLPTLAQRGREIISNIITGLSENMPAIISKAVEIISMFAQNWLANITTFITLGIQLLTKIIEGIAQNMPAIVNAIITVVTTLITTAVSLLPQIIQLGVDLLLALIDGILQNLPAIIDAAILAIETLVNALIENLPLILDAAIEIIMALLDGLIEALPQLLEAGFEIIVTLVEAIITHLPEIIEASWEIIKAIVQGLSDLKQSLFDAGKELMTKLIDIITEKCGELLTKTVEKFTELKDKCADKIEELKEEAREKFTELKEKAITNFGELKQKATDEFNQLKTQTINKVTEMRTQAINKFNELKTQAINKVTEIKTQTVNKFNELKNDAINKVNELKNDAVNKFNELKNKISSKISDAVTEARNKFNEMKTNVVNKIQEMKNSAVSKMESMASSMVTALRNLPSKLRQAARDAVQGLIDGLGEKLQAVKRKAQEIADTVAGALKNALKIKSPSRLIRDEVGKMIPQGLAVGIEADTDKAVKSAENLAKSVALGSVVDPVRTAVNSTGYSNNMYNSNSGNQMQSTLNAILHALDGSSAENNGVNITIQEFNNHTEEDINNLMQRMAAQIKLNNLGKGVR